MLNLEDWGTHAITTREVDGREVAQSTPAPCSGIYICTPHPFCNEALYVGQSINMLNRWKQHHKAMPAVKAGATTLRTAYCPKVYLDVFEGLLIRALEPELNGRHKYVPPLTERQAQVAAADFCQQQPTPSVADLFAGLVMDHSQYKRHGGWGLRHRPGEDMAGNGRDATRRRRICTALWNHLESIDPDATPDPEILRDWSFRFHKYASAAA